MSDQYYLKDDLVESLYTTFRLYQSRFSKDGTKVQVDTYIDRVIPDDINGIFTTRHIRSTNAKIIYFMNSKLNHHYDMLMEELKGIPFFLMTYKDICDSSCTYVNKDTMDRIIEYFTLDAFSLRANIENKIKDLKIYKEINEGIYDESRS